MPNFEKYHTFSISFGTDRIENPISKFHIRAQILSKVKTPDIKIQHIFKVYMSERVCMQFDYHQTILKGRNIRNTLRRFRLGQTFFSFGTDIIYHLSRGAYITTITK